MWVRKSTLMRRIALIALTLSSTLIAEAKLKANTNRVSQISAEKVLKSLAEQGLPIVNEIIFDAKTDPNRLLGRPGGYLSKVSFFDARYLDRDSDGNYQHTIEVFVTPAAAQTRKRYIEKVTNGVPFLAQYQFNSGRILLRLDKALTPDEADKYNAALIKIGG